MVLHGLHRNMGTSIHTADDICSSVTFLTFPKMFCKTMRKDMMTTIIRADTVIFVWKNWHLVLLMIKDQLVKDNIQGRAYILFRPVVIPVVLPVVKPV